MRKKLLISYIVIVFSLTLSLSLFLAYTVKKAYYNSYAERILNESRMLADIAENADVSPQKFADKYSADLGVRLTIINAEGEALADSALYAEEMENHSQRSEIKAALKGVTKTEIRRSQSLGEDMLYCAVPAVFNGENVALRCSIALSEINSIRGAFMASIFIIMFFVSVAAVIISAWFSEKISRPITELTAAANDLSNGGYGKQIVLIDGDAATEQLAKSFNAMSVTLAETIAKLENENARLEAIVNSMVSGVIAVDNDDRVMLVNSVFCRIFGIEQSKTKGESIYDALRNENIFASLENCVKTGEHIEDEFVLNDGRILRAFANPIVNFKHNNEIIGRLIVAEDVTRIRKLEKLRSDFVSNVTHELKTPLTSIMGFTDTLKSGAINDAKAAAHFLDIIDIEANRLYRLILDILSLSEIETKKDDDNKEYTNIGKLAADVCETLKPQAEKKNISINVLSEDLPPFLCNRDRICQMLLNLIDNAVKYTEEGKVDVICRREENNLVIMVKDTGIGIPKEARERIFERFYRVDKGRSRKAGSAGLGLSIVKHIAILYEGRVCADENAVDGRGSVFTVKMPYRV